MKNPAASQAIVASSVFLELVDFSKLPMSVQVQTKNHFNATLRLGLSELGENNYWVRDQGDGTLIVCQNSPEHALFLALNVYNAFMSLALPLSEFKPTLRIGLHLGVLKSNPDLDGRANYLGDGITATQRLMDFAQPGQILASRAFVDAVSSLHADFSSMFLSPESYPDKHGRLHDVYTVQPSSDALARLTEEIAARALHLSLTTALAATPAPTVTHSSMLEHATLIIRNWFAPFNALLFMVGALWAGFQRFGLSGWQAEVFGLSLSFVGAVVWLVFRRGATGSTAATPSKRTLPAIGLVIVAIGCMVMATGWLSTLSNTPTPAVPLQVQATKPTAEASPAVLPLQKTATIEPPQLPAGIVSNKAPPASTPVVETKMKAQPAEKKRSQVAIVADTPSAQVSDASRHRCTALLNRSALGETISAADKQELIQSCR